jgi:repressor LexA
MDALYESIKQLRLERGMSQAELAKMTGYTDRSSITKIENGEVDLQRSKIMLFAKALRVDPGDLFDGTVNISNMKPLEKANPEDVKLLHAYYSAPNSIQTAVRKLLDLEEGD